jgi:hypothetical protein
MVCFQTNNPNLGKFWRAREWKILAYVTVIWNITYTSIWYILWPFGNVLLIWYIFPRFGILRREKSGNPAIYVRKNPNPSGPIKVVRT